MGGVGTVLAMAEAQRSTPARTPLWPTLAIVALFLAPALVLILSGALLGRPAWDQHNYHEPMIRTFAREWPNPDFSNYLSATTPLYHLVLAAVARYISSSTVALQIAGSLFTVALLALISHACARRMPGRPWLALAACLPLTASLYVFPAGVWLLPDNAGWLGVAALLLIALRPRVTVATLVAGAIVLGLLVLTRQIHVWCAALLWVVAWMGDRDGPTAVGDGEPLLPVADLMTNASARLGRTLLAVVLTAPAFALVGLFVSTWGGLTVPRYQGMYHGWGPATPAFVLSLLAIYSVFFGGWLAPALLEAIRNRRATLACAAVLGLLAAAAPDTTYNLDQGRFSGLWQIVEKAPILAGRTSLLLLILAPLGAMALALWLAPLKRRARVVMLTAFVAFVASQMASPLPWQRYHEPMLLMLIALMACQAGDASSRAPVLRSIMGAGPVLMACLFAVLTGLSINGGERAPDKPRDPRASPHYRGPPDPPPQVYIERLPDGPAP